MPSYTRADLENNPELRQRDNERLERGAKARDRRKGLELQKEANLIARKALTRATTANWIAVGAAVLAVLALVLSG